MLALPATALAQAPDRYSIANGCFALRDAASGATVSGGERLRLQATTLGSYLLYRPDRTFLTAAGPKADPSPAAADWRVREAGGGTFRLTSAAGTALGGGRRYRLATAAGCAAYPEAELNATRHAGEGRRRRTARSAASSRATCTG